VWSEPIFILLTSGYVYALWRYVHSSTWQWWWVLTACGFLMPLQRTAGLLLLVGIGLGGLLFYRAFLLRHWRALLVHGLIAVSGSLCWQYYSLVVVAGRDLQTFHDLYMVVVACGEFGYVLAVWLLPMVGGPEHAYTLFAGLLGLFALIILLGVPAWQPFVRLLAVAALVYLAGHVYLTWRATIGGSRYEAERFAAGVQAPILLALAVVAERFVTRQKLLLVGCSCWVLYSLVRFGHNAQFLHQAKPSASATQQITEVISRPSTALLAAYRGNRPADRQRFS
jgi:hypothetical protein